MAAAESPGSGGVADAGRQGSAVVVTGAGSGFDEHLATNIRAPHFLIQAALPSLRESALRSVVNISSSSGTQMTPYA